ncbi:CHAT domain-containing protein [Oxynema aestuarii]|uniref:CHAT domain-containing protein n=1 Tax=Oxynema aestuarii AP17 TaxID=2064643 RepID=A0A6H1TY30_9CYAN|nr:CHAT domain-containing protein [Oxynema aestuarii]QIZ70269.1 CHAT domain-containing protein [Oxynema aestuarii AP17]
MKERRRSPRLGVGILGNLIVKWQLFPLFLGVAIAGSAMASDSRVNIAPDSPLGPPLTAIAQTQTPSDTPTEEPRVLVSEVVVEGADGDLAQLVYDTIELKPQGITTRSGLQDDINAVFATGFFANVRAIPEDTPVGVRVTFIVEPNPILKTVRVEGTQVLPQAVIEDIFAPQYGKIVNFKALEEHILRLNQWYQERGYALAQINFSELSPDGVVSLVAAEGVIETVRIRVVDDLNPDSNIDEFITLESSIDDPETKAGSVFNKEAAMRDLQRLENLEDFDLATINLTPGNNPAQAIVTFEVTRIENDVLALVKAADREVKEAPFPESELFRQQVLPKYERAANLYAENKNFLKQAAVLRRMGNLFSKAVESWLDQKPQAPPLSSLVNVSKQPDDILGLSELFKAPDSSEWEAEKLKKEEEALAYFKGAIAIYEELGNEWGKVQEEYHLGRQYRLWEEPQKAIAQFEKVVEACDRLDVAGCGWLQVASFNELAAIYQELGDVEGAIAAYKNTIARIGNLNPEDIPKGNLGFSIGWDKKNYEIKPTLKYEFNIEVRGEDGGLQDEIEPENETSIDSKEEARQSLKPFVLGMSLAKLGQLYRTLGDSRAREEALTSAIALLEREMELSRTDDRSFYSEAVFIGAAALAYVEARDYTNAIAKLESGLELANRLEKPEWGVSFLLGSAWAAYSFGDGDRTRELLDRADEAIELVKVPEALAGLRLVAGWLAYKLDRDDRATAKVASAFSQIEALPDNEIEVLLLLTAGFVFDDLDDRDRTFAAVDKAFEQIRQGITPEQKQSILSFLPVVPEVLQMFDKPNLAIPVYEQLGEFYEQETDDRSQAANFALKNAQIYGSQGKRETAIAQFERARSLYREAGDRSGEGNVLLELGDFYRQWGEYQRAIEALQQATRQLEQSDRPELATLALNGIAQLYDTLAEPQQALDAYDRAIALARKTDDRDREITLSINLGQFHRAWGNYEQAIEAYTNARTALKKAADSETSQEQLERAQTAISSLLSQEGFSEFLQTFVQSESEAVILAKMSLVYVDMGRKNEAIAAFREAVELASAQKAIDVKQRLFLQGAILYEALGDWEQAIFYLEQARQGASGNNATNAKDRLAETDILLFLGRLRARGDRPAEALENLNEALDLARELGRPSTEIEVLYEIAKIERDRGNLSEARDRVERAIGILESLRSKVVSQQLRTSFFASKQSYYEFYIDLLMQLHREQPDAGYDAQALAASEAARARSLIELLAESGTEIRKDVDPSLVEKERTLQEQIDLTASQQIELLSGQHTPEQAAAIAENLDNLLREYEDVQAQIRAQSPRYAALTQPQPLDFAQIQQRVLEEGTLLLEYYFGAERSYLWVASHDGLTSYELPPREAIEKAARNFRDAMTDPKIRYNEFRVAGAARILSDMILGPAAPLLEDRRLLVVGDGALQYIPFAALPIPEDTPDDDPRGTPLVVKHEIVNLPSASTLAILREENRDRPGGKTRVAVLADPVFAADDGRLTGQPAASISEKASDLRDAVSRSAGEVGVAIPPSRLPFTRQEAEQILALVPEENRYIALDFEANRQTILGDRLKDYEIVHLATHGFLNSVNPELSGLVLSLVDENGKTQDGFLRLHEIYNLNLPAELIVLSACQTGLGAEIRGEGLVGLTRGFMYSGARRVLVSLWNVNDKGTSILMTKFYKKMLQDNLTPTAALRAAQLEMWESQEWKSPYYWGAFVLQGEWQ